MCVVVINKINQLCLTRVAHNSHMTEKPVALEFPIELEFRNVDSVCLLDASQLACSYQPLSATK